jgi:hypothetical protein
MAAAEAPAAGDLAMGATLSQKLADPAEVRSDPPLGDVTGPSASSSSAAAAKPAAAPTTTTDKKADEEKRSEPLRGAVIGGKSGGVVVTMGQVLAAVAAFNFLLAALFLLWWDPHLYLLGGAVTSGLGFGVLVSYLYYKNLKRKSELQELVSEIAPSRRRPPPPPARPSPAHAPP